MGTGNPLDPVLTGKCWYHFSCHTLSIASLCVCHLPVLYKYLNLPPVLKSNLPPVFIHRCSSEVPIFLQLVSSPFDLKIFACLRYPYMTFRT
jgi:hypothetical protein